MIKRQILEGRLKNIENQISELETQWSDIKKEWYLMTDEERWYTEAEEVITVKRRPKQTVIRLIGRTNWKEKFTDDSTGEFVWIDRNMVIKQDGEWII